MVRARASRTNEPAVKAATFSWSASPASSDAAYTASLVSTTLSGLTSLSAATLSVIRSISDQVSTVAEMQDILGTLTAIDSMGFDSSTSYYNTSSIKAGFQIFL